MFSWKLEGFDREWSLPSSLSVASYSNLEPGSYNLQVRVFNENDSSVSEMRSIGIIVQPPFWSSIYAYVFYALLSFMGCLYALSLFH